MQFKADVLPGTKYRPLPRITNLEKMNNYLSYMQLSSLGKEE